MVPENRYLAPILKFGKEKRDRSRCRFVCPQFATWEHMAIHQGRCPGEARSHNNMRSRSPIHSQPTSPGCLSNEFTLPL